MKWMKTVSTRNVVNTDEIDAFVGRVSKRARFEQVREWLRTTYRKWLIKHASGEDILPDPDADGLSLFDLVARDQETWRTTRYFGPTPDWMLDAMCRGDRIVKVRCGPVREHDAWLCIDWLNSLYGDPVFDRLSRISYPQGVEAARLWRDQLARRRSQEDEAGDTEVVHQFGDGYRIVDIKTARGLKREGRLMRHCAASYEDELKDGTRVLSLRDPQNRPHCTLEVMQRRVLQVKGKQNRAPVARYRPYVRQFVVGNNLALKGDARNVGLLFVNNAFCDDINEYAARWSHEEAAKNHAGSMEDRTDRFVSTEPLRTIAKFSDELSNGVCRRLFEDLSSGFSNGVRFIVQNELDIFGEEFSVMRVDYPFELLFLKRKRVFRDLELRREVDRIVERGVSTLLTGLDRHPNWFFCLMLNDKDWDYDGPLEVDLLSASGFDLRHVRHRRFTEIRSRLAAIRRRNRKRLDDYSIPEETRTRWRHDWHRAQDILQGSTAAFI